MRDLGEVEAELRDAGWGDSEVRSFIKGYQSVPDQRSIPLPPPRPAPLPAVVSVQAPQPGGRGDRGIWARTTLAGQLKAVTSVDDPEADAKEMRAAREFIDDHEYRYGRRLTMTEARLAVRPPGGEGVVLSGTAEEVGLAFRQAGVPYAIVSEMRPLPPPSSVTHQPTHQ